MGCREERGWGEERGERGEGDRNEVGKEREQRGQ